MGVLGKTIKVAREVGNLQAEIQTRDHLHVKSECQPLAHTMVLVVMLKKSETRPGVQEGCNILSKHRGTC
jgi:hypothetical protein